MDASATSSICLLYGSGAQNSVVYMEHLARYIKVPTCSVLAPIRYLPRSVQYYLLNRVGRLESPELTLKMPLFIMTSKLVAKYAKTSHQHARDLV